MESKNFDLHQSNFSAFFLNLYKRFILDLFWNFHGFFNSLIFTHFFCKSVNTKFDLIPILRNHKTFLNFSLNFQQKFRFSPNFFREFFCRTCTRTTMCGCRSRKARFRRTTRGACTSTTWARKLWTSSPCATASSKFIRQNFAQIWKNSKFKKIYFNNFLIKIFENVDEECKCLQFFDHFSY